jgi:DNA-binding CsgD family transcriptional regulator
MAALALAMAEDVAQTLASAQDGGESAPLRPARRAGPLSEREREVLRLVAEGLPNKAIARRLFISANTVNFHLTSVFRKLGVDTRAHAVAVAARHGLL